MSRESWIPRGWLALVLSAAVWLGPLTESASAQVTCFTAGQSFSPGRNPNKIAVGDVNEDGKPDLAVPLSSDDSVAIRLGVGDGTFTVAANVASGDVPIAVGLADFDGDGHLDLAVPSQVDDNVAIKPGRGDGTFQTGITVGVGGDPESVAVGDFNGDGRPDLAVANTIGDNVSILRNSTPSGGGLAFTAEQNVGVQDRPESVVAGDFNGDGRPDLAVANRLSDTVSILLRDANGAYATRTLNVGDAPRQVVTADFNGDGALDLATANDDSDNVSILLGLGDGTFTAVTAVAAGDRPLSLAAGDFDGDGPLDLAVGNHRSNNVSILLGTGTGRFNPAASFGPAADVRFVAVGDFNADGALDLALGLDHPGQAPPQPAAGDVVIALNTCDQNAPPVNSVPGPRATNEDTGLTFSTAAGNAISVADPDAGTGQVRVTLSVDGGTLTLGRTTGLSFSSGDGTADPTMTFTGTLTSINNALNGLGFAPPANVSGTRTLTITTNDQGRTGVGGPQSDSDTVQITINPVNDPPANTVPGAQATSEDTPLVFSAGNGNPIGVADVDAGSNPVRVTLSATNGTLTLGSSAGLTVGGDGTATVTATGSIADLNTGLNGLRFDPTPGFSGPATLQITSDDQGHSGVGGALTDSDTVQITVGGVNDGPINTVPGAQATDEDVALVFSTGNGNPIGVADPDAGAGPVQVTLSATNGTLTLNGTAGLTVSTGDGTADATMTFTGTLDAINTALNGLRFVPSADFSGPATLQIATSDQGSTGSGGPLTDTDAVQITVSPVNDPPTIADVIDQGTAQGTPKTVPFTVGDIDSPVGSLTLSGRSNNQALVPDASITIGGPGADRTVTISPAPGQTGTVTITLTVSDGALTASDSFVLTVDDVNDPPTISNLPDQATREGTPTSAIPFSIADDTTPIAGLTLVASSSNSALVPDRNVAFGGAGANRTLTVTPAAGQTGTVTITVTVSDGTLSTGDTFVLTVTSGPSAPPGPPPGPPPGAPPGSPPGSATTRFALTVAVAGSGVGTVASAPGGITCRPDCAGEYAEGTVAVLTASPARHSVFAGWSGACSGTGTCAVTLDRARAITATFTRPTCRTPDGRTLQATIAGAGLIYGTRGPDVIVGSQRGDVIRAFGGDDVICAAGGNDRVDAGAGNDTVDAGAGIDFVDGGPGNDLVVGGDGNDVLRGRDGDDTLRGGAGNDVLGGGPGRDRLLGEGGNDRILGEQGDDALDGGEGTDTCFRGPTRFDDTAAACEAVGDNP